MASDLPGGVVAPVLRTRAFTRDSVGLSAGAREQNIAGRVIVRARPGDEVVLVDDVSTTGATACESVRVLQSTGTRVSAVVVVANA
jgi:predicted amidophosphoribosyltransferase